MRRDFDSWESSTERLRRRLEERQEKMERNTRPRINPFTLLSIVIILIIFAIANR